MITGKIILKSATKLSLDKRFSEIAKQTPPPQQQQQTNVIIPASRQQLFGNRRAPQLSIAQRLKKRSINNQLGRGPAGNFRPFNYDPVRTRVFQRLSFANRRRGGGGGGNNSGGNPYLFGGQSGLGVRLRGQGRVGGPRTFRNRTRGFLNNNAIGRFTRGNRNNIIRGRRNNNYNNYNNNNNNNNNFNRGRGRGNFNRGRGRGQGQGQGRGRGRGRGQNNNNRNNNPNLSKENLDSDLDKYMSQTKIGNDGIDMDAV